MLRGWTWILALTILGVASCERGPSAEGVGPCREIRLDEQAGARRRSVVVIVNDTMRRDRIGAYGGPASTPAFDAFARENLLFERASTQSPWTKPSIATLFTSLYPSQHGVASDPQLRNPFDVQRKGELIDTDVLSDDLQTMPEVLKAAGYATAAFVSNPWMEKRFGFAQGFDVYDDSFARWGLRGDVVSRAGLDWLRRQQPGTPFFLYLHYLDSHLPYGTLDRERLERRAQELAADDRPLGEQAMRAVQMVARFPDGVSPLTLGYRPSLGLIEMAYDSGVADFDQALALFLDGFREHWAYEETAILVTSDHGEALFERGYGNHGNGLFDDEIAIPMAGRFPGTRSETSRIGCIVGLVDVLPTLCSYLDLTCPDDVAGWSFIETGRGDRSDQKRYMVSEGVVQRPEHRAIRNRNYKLLWETRPRADGKKKANPYSLYDIVEDPGERNDLLASPDPPRHVRRVFETMSAALHEAVPDHRAPRSERLPIDPALRERLRNLGYTE